MPAPEPGGYELFISYASRDEVTDIGGRRILVVQEIKTMLEGHRHPANGRRFRVCSFRDDFDLSGNLPEVISARLRESSHLLVLCSRYAARSRWVQRELREFKALHGGSAILPAWLRLDPAEAFPDYFEKEGLAANLSFNAQTSASDWLAQAAMESHKLVARVWQVELRAVHDRFEEERRRSEQLDLEARAALAELLAQEEGRGSDALVRAVESAGRSVLRELDPPGRAFGALATSIGAARAIQIVGHAGPVDAAEFSPDGAYVLTGGTDHTARIWSARDGCLVKTLDAHSSAVGSVDVSPDGTRAVTGSADGAAVLWTFPEGRLLQALAHGGPGRVRARFSADGSLVLTLTEGLRIWSAEDGRLVLPFDRPNPDYSTQSAVSPDGSRYLCWEGPRRALIWDVQTGGLLATLTEDQDGVFAPVFSPDGSRVYISRTNGTGSLWHVEAGTKVALPKGAAWSNPTFSDDGTQVAIPEGSGNMCRVVSTTDGAEITLLHGHDDFVHTGCFSPDGGLMVTASADRTARLWRHSDGKVLAILPHSESVVRANTTRGGERILTVTRNGVVTLWPREVHAARAVLDAGSGIQNAAWAPSGDYLACAGTDGRLYLWTIADAPAEPTASGHQKAIAAVAVSPDSRQVCSVGHDGATILWNPIGKTERGRAPMQTGGAMKGVTFSADGTRILTWGTEGGAWVSNADTGELLKSLDGHPSVNDAALSRDGLRAVTGSSDESAILWDLETTRPIRRLAGHDGWVWTVAFSPDSLRIVTGARDRQRRSVAVWDGLTGEQIAMPENQGKWVRRVAFAPDSALFASAGSDFNIGLWNSATGTPVATLRGHTGVVEALDFSPDSLRVASGGADRTVRLWDVATHRPLAVFRGHASGIVSIRYSPNGQWIASLDQNGRVLLYPGSLGALLGLAFHVLQGRPHFDQVRSVFEDLSDLKTFTGEVFGPSPEQR